MMATMPPMSAPSFCQCVYGSPAAPPTCRRPAEERGVEPGRSHRVARHQLAPAEGALLAPQADTLVLLRLPHADYRARRIAQHRHSPMLGDIDGAGEHGPAQRLGL